MSQWTAILVNAAISALFMVGNYLVARKLLQAKRSEQLPFDVTEIRGLTSKQEAAILALAKEMGEYKREMERRAHEAEERIERNEHDLVAARGQIKYLQGVLNGKFWKQQEE